MYLKKLSLILRLFSHSPAFHSTASFTPPLPPPPLCSSTAFIFFKRVKFSRSSPSPKRRQNKYIACSIQSLQILSANPVNLTFIFSCFFHHFVRILSIKACIPTIRKRTLFSFKISATLTKHSTWSFRKGATFSLWGDCSNFLFFITGLRSPSSCLRCADDAQRVMRAFLCECFVVGAHTSPTEPDECE